MNSENEIPVTLSELMELLEDIGNYQRDEGNSAKGESNSGSATSIPNETTNSVGVASKIHEHTSPRPPRKRIRKVGSVPYSTVLQRRRRAELLSLRSEAQELERRLAQLQQSHIEEAKPLARKSQPGRGNWRSVAINARKERYHTECTNRELKEILSNRLNMFASIQKILRQSGGFEEIEILSQTQMRISPSLDQAVTANSVLAQITDSLERMHLRADSVFPALDDYLTVALRTYKRRHEICGTLGDNCIETISVTPMPCSTSQSGMILWQQLVSRKNTEPDKLYRFIREKHNACLEMSFTLPSHDENYGILYVDAVSAYRKYEEKNRFVLVGKTNWILRAGGLEFETLHWTVISPSSTNSSQSSVVQSCNCLRVKKLDPGSVEAAHVQNMLLTSIGSKLRNFMKNLQNELLQSAAAHPSQQKHKST